MAHLSANDFRPDRDGESIQNWIPSSRPIEYLDRQTVQLPLEDTFSFHYLELGRLLILNGKFRQVGVKLIVTCSPCLSEKFHALGIDRILWIDTQATL